MARMSTSHGGLGLAIGGWALAGLLLVLLAVLNYPPLVEYHAGFQEGVYRVRIAVTNRTAAAQLVKVFLLNPARPEVNPYAHWVEEETIPPRAQREVTYFIGQDPRISDVYIGVAAFRTTGDSRHGVLKPQNLSCFSVLHREKYVWGSLYGSVEIEPK